MLFEMNEYLFLKLNLLAQFDTIRTMAFFLADAPIFAIPLFFIAFWIFYAKNGNRKGKETLLLIFYPTVLAILSDIAIQSVFRVERPFTYAQNKANLILIHVPNASFPSDHASIATAFLVALFLFGYRKTGYTLLPFFVLMLFSRVVG